MSQKLLDGMNREKTWSKGLLSSLQELSMNDQKGKEKNSCLTKVIEK